MSDKKLWVARVEVEMIVAAETATAARHVAARGVSEEVDNDTCDIEASPLDAASHRWLVKDYVDHDACPHGDATRTVAEYLKAAP